MALIPSFLRRTDGVSDQDFLDAAADIGADRLERYAMFAGYYGGDHNVKLTDRARKWLEPNPGVCFAENFCEPVVDSYVDRLAITGFQTSLPPVTVDGREEPSALDGWVNGELWDRNRMDAVQGKAHVHALIKGDAFLIVDTPSVDGGVPRLVFNRPELVNVSYSDDDPDVVEWASKVWNTVVDGRVATRLNVYRADRVEKWFRLVKAGGKGGWAPFADGVVPWLDGAGEPRGVPVFHLRHRALDHPYGRSELRSVVPQQDLLNKQVVDLALVLDNYGEPSRWATGVAKDNASATQSPGAWFVAENEAARFGQFEIADAARLGDQIEATISRIARRSRTPLHLLTSGDMPSGEALKTAEAGLVAKVKASHVPFGNVWEDAILMAVRVAADLGLVERPPDDLTVECQWANPESRSRLDDSDAALKMHELGVSRHTLVRELGYDPDEEADRRAAETEAAMDTVGSMLDRGAFAGDDGDTGRSGPGEG